MRRAWAAVGARISATTGFEREFRQTTVAVSCGRLRLELPSLWGLSKRLVEGGSRDHIPPPSTFSSRLQRSRGRRVGLDPALNAIGCYVELELGSALLVRVGGNPMDSQGLIWRPSLQLILAAERLQGSLCKGMIQVWRKGKAIANRSPAFQLSVPI